MGREQVAWDESKSRGTRTSRVGQERSCMGREVVAWEMSRGMGGRLGHGTFWISNCRSFSSFTPLGGGRFCLILLFRAKSDGGGDRRRLSKETTVRESDLELVSKHSLSSLNSEKLKQVDSAMQ